MTCGHQELTNVVGMFASPGYPVAYQSNTTCTWHIYAILSYRVKLHLQIDAIESYSKCAHDAILVKLCILGIL